MSEMQTDEEIRKQLEETLKSAIDLIKYFSKFSRDSIILKDQLLELEKFKSELLETQVRYMAKRWLKKHNISI